MTSKPSPFIWHDLMTPDVKAAEAFYAKVVGWKIADSGMPGMSYSILSAGDVMVGGMMGAVPGGPPPMWTGYIYSADVDADAKRAKKLGGSVCREPDDIPGVGRFAVIADPGGAMFNLFKPNSTETPKEIQPGTPGQFVWNDLRAADGTAAWKFYSKLFNWTKAEAMDMGADGVYQMFATGKEPAGGMMTKRPGTADAHWTYFIQIDDIDAAAARLKGSGGEIIMGPMQVPGGEWILEARDPQGANFGLVGPKR